MALTSHWFLSACRPHDWSPLQKHRFPPLTLLAPLSETTNGPQTLFYCYKWKKESEPPNKWQHHQVSSTSCRVPLLCLWLLISFLYLLAWLNTSGVIRDGKPSEVHLMTNIQHMPWQWTECVRVCMCVWYRGTRIPWAQWQQSFADPMTWFDVHCFLLCVDVCPIVKEFVVEHKVKKLLLLVRDNWY